jgi:hypothetical protein
VDHFIEPAAAGSLVIVPVDLIEFRAQGNVTGCDTRRCRIVSWLTLMESMQATRKGELPTTGQGKPYPAKQGSAMLKGARKLSSIALDLAYNSVRDRSQIRSVCG